MFRPTPLFIGWRYVRAVQSERVITLYALISVVGLALGVTVLIIVLSILNGFEREFKQRILGLVAPVKLYANHDWVDWQNDIKQLSQLPVWSQVEGYAPFIEMPGMLVNGKRTETIYLSAIDPEREAEVSPLAGYLLDHYEIAELFESQPEGVILGYAIAQKLGLRTGDSVKLLLAPPIKSTINGMPHSLPKSVVLPVSAIIATRTELDRQLALVNIAHAQALLGREGVMGVKLSLRNVMQAHSVAKQFRSELYSVKSSTHWSIIDWVQTHGNLYQAIKLPQTIMWMLLVFILLVAAFNMTTTLFMMVRQKRKELAVLQTFGATTWQLASAFLAQGSIVALLGVLSGLVLGVVLASSLPEFIHLLEKISGRVLFQGDSYFIQFLPVQIELLDLLVVASTAFALSFIAVMLPALKAARMEPVQALRGDE